MTTERNMHLAAVTPPEFNTMLAALRFWQRQGNMSHLPEYEIASDGQHDDDMPSALDDASIDELCERLNCDSSALAAILTEAVAAWPQFDPASPRHDQEVNGGDMVEWFGGFLQRARAALGGDIPPAAPSLDWRSIAEGLAGALDACTGQIGQMRGMFPDDDGAIQQALGDADVVGALYWSAVKASPAAPSAPLQMWTCTTDGNNCPLTTTVHATEVAAWGRVREDLLADCSPRHLDLVNSMIPDQLLELWHRKNDGACMIERHDVPATSYASPADQASAWVALAETHRDAMRANLTIEDDSPDERKAHAADAVAEALAQYGRLAAAVALDLAFAGQDEQAAAEGWGLFETDSRGLKIQADSDSSIFCRGGFSHHDEAEAFVRAKAAEGSAYHIAALARLAPDAERKFVVVEVDGQHWVCVDLDSPGSNPLHNPVEGPFPTNEAAEEFVKTLRPASL